MRLARRSYHQALPDTLTANTMILDWFNAKEAVAFGESLASEIALQMPLEAVQKKRRSEKKGFNALNGLVLRVRAFGLQTPLNIYKKAKFLNVIKWQLRGSGYDEPFINEVIVLFTAALNT